MELEHLQMLWFGIFAILVTGYAVLDGFDLGVGILQPLFSKDDYDRRVMLNTIGPVWDGNEVWLVTAGGALFAGFPAVYATFFSALYTPFMVLLAALIFRAVAIEFRSKKPMKWWRSCWDWMFSLSSLVITLCMGVALGKLVTGIPLDAQQEFNGSLGDLFDPYSLLMAVTATALFTMHGCIYAVMKTEGETHDRLRVWVNPTIIFFIICYALLTMVTLIYLPHMTEALRDRPIFFLLAVFNMLAIANIPREISRGKDGRAFLCSSLSIIFLMLLFAVGTFPTVLRASNDPEHLSLTIYNASSSYLTLKTLLIIAGIGFPMIISYTIGIYWVFRGKVKLDKTSY
ncbi:MAG: cydB [Chlamydiales bacterium]|jgi:cytochrome d ubiquinol oxidase subunit II|nr:cydB [Chlamydiales bacterium]